MRTTYFTFDTTHHALWAEELARSEGLATDLVPAPAGAHARCDLALIAFLDDEPRMTEVLEAGGVPFSIFREPDAAAEARPVREST
jgi:hypothetical protein